MNKPDWKDAPDWANWLAMDSDGVWGWHNHEPEYKRGEVRDKFGFWESNESFDESEGEFAYAGVSSGIKLFCDHSLAESTKEQRPTNNQMD